MADEAWPTVDIEDRDAVRLRHVRTVEEFRKVLAECEGDIKFPDGRRAPLSAMHDASDDLLTAFLGYVRSALTPVTDGQRKGSSKGTCAP